MFRPLKDFLPHALNKTGARQSVEAVVVVEAVGPIILQIVPSLRPADFRVVSYHQATVTVATGSPAAASELRLRAEPILEVLRETFPSQPFRSLRFVPLLEPDAEF